MTPGPLPSARRFRLISFPVSRRRSAVNSIIAIFSLLLDEQRAYRILEVDPLDGLAQQGRHRKDADLLAGRLGAQRDRVGHHEVLDLRFLEPLDGGTRQDGVGGAGGGRVGPAPPPCPPCRRAGSPSFPRPRR